MYLRSKYGSHVTDTMVRVFLNRCTKEYILEYNNDSHMHALCLLYDVIFNYQYIHVLEFMNVFHT